MVKLTKQELLDKETLTVAEKLEVLESSDITSGEIGQILLKHLEEEHGTP